ncbi:MAG: glycosyltransferase family 39 protein [Pirellulaceae bacterium]|nr:glycosyltransferase family 39 protein [Pirellulaceae bacterium]
MSFLSSTTMPRTCNAPRVLAWPVLVRFLATWAGLAAPWLALWYWFSELGGWPLNDDPFYAKPLAFWASDGRWQLVRQYDELTASSVAHIVTGGLAVWGRDFGYRALFLVCLLQQAMGAAALYWLGRHLSLDRRLSVLAALTLICFPLYFGHGFTFMTDGPAAAWSAIALVCLLAGLMRRHVPLLVIGALATGWGYWIRQTNGLILLAGLAAWCLLFVPGWVNRSLRTQSLPSSGGLSSASTSPTVSHGTPLWPLCLMLSLVGCAVGLLESGWLIPSSASRVKDIAPQTGEGYWKQLAIATYGWLLLAGWFAVAWVPLFYRQAVLASRSLSLRSRRLCVCVAAFVLLVGLSPLVATSGRAHITNSTGAFIQNAHFGPIFLSDMDLPGRWGDLCGVAWPAWVWQCLSVLSIVGAACLAWWAAWNTSQAWTTMLTGHTEPLIACGLACLVMIGASVTAIVLFVEPHMDRYWLFLMPVLAIWWLLMAAHGRWQLTRPAIAWALLWLGVNLAGATIFTHDMLAWNNARWQFVNAHLAAGHSADSIDAGRDVNAWLRMDEDPRTSARPGDSSPWWSGRASLAIASGPRPGWHTYSQLPWPAWATGQTHHLLVLAPDD